MKSQTDGKEDYLLNKKNMKKKEDIYKKLSSLGYKIDFWYEKGQLDAICIAQWYDKDLIWKKTYKVEDIARILFNDYLNDNK